MNGCRVLDLGIITAGAATSALLADIGADVIKIESPTYRDPFRKWTSTPPPDATSSLPPFFRATNRNKSGISLDLKSAAGNEAFLRLVERSDVVVENFRRGVMPRLGLGYERLRAANPQIILASISSQGDTGPDAGYVSYGSTLEAVGGLAWRTGYSDDGPVVSGRDLNYPDQVVAIFAAAMIMTAWRARRGGSGGAHLDLSQRELTSFLSGEAFVAAAATAESPRNGNAQAPHLVQDCFRSSDEVWVAVTIDGRDVPALERVLGRGLETDGTDALRVALAEWISARDSSSCVERLSAASIAVAPVLNGKQVLDGAGRGWNYGLTRATDGSLVKGFPFQLEASPLAISCDAPALGADTAEVLTKIGGYSRAEVAALASAGVIELDDETARQPLRTTQ
ncbi:MAG: CoA transferase [Proteobacteria bacterium]|nr:CoA transferase [Pseudomonadota bacterium]